jgi:heme/copper-type cytochrome/quinol oxidase subunit 3
VWSDNVATEVPTAHTAATSTGYDSRKLFMWTFLGSECLFFGSLIATFILYRGRSLEGPGPKDVFNIPYTSVSTFVLLMSSLTMVLALAAIQRGDMRAFRVWILATALLGCTFLGGQAFEFSDFVEKGLRPGTNLFGSTFFVLTGIHGTHVGIGVLMLLSLFGFSFTGKVKQQSSLYVELIGLYWHFVDIVWIVIFTVIYLARV